MKCPKCGKNCKKGVVHARNPRMMVIDWPGDLRWYPEESAGKLLKSGEVQLSYEGEGFYCEDCEKVYAVFEANEMGI